MKIRQFRYSRDNLGYVLHSGGLAMVIDGGSPSAILDFVADSGLRLIYVTNTHSHPDHTCGNRRLLEGSTAEFIVFGDPDSLTEIALGDSKVSVLHTPGHTADSVCFLAEGILVSGDTLFNGKVGRCFTGDAAGFRRSIDELAALPDGTMVYAGHDYVEEYLDWDREIMPSNPHIDPYLSAYDPELVTYTLGDERLVDPFLRLDSKDVMETLAGRGLPCGTKLERWNSLLSIM